MPLRERPRLLKSSLQPCVASHPLTDAIFHYFILCVRKSLRRIHASHLPVRGGGFEVHDSTWLLKKVGEKPEQLGREHVLESDRSHFSTATTRHNHLLGSPSDRVFRRYQRLELRSHILESSLHCASQPVERPGDNSSFPLNAKRQIFQSFGTEHRYCVNASVTVR